MVALYHAGEGLEHRHVDAATAPGLLARVQGHRDAVHGMQSRHAVGDDQRHVARSALRRTGLQIGDAHRTLDQIVVRGPAGVRSALAVAVHAAPDNVRPDRPDLFDPRPSPSIDAGRRLCMHVGPGQQPAHRS
jgi:hypothetical protein